MPRASELEGDTHHLVVYQQPDAAAAKLVCKRGETFEHGLRLECHNVCVSEAPRDGEGGRESEGDGASGRCQAQAMPVRLPVGCECPDVHVGLPDPWAGAVEQPDGGEQTKHVCVTRSQVDVCTPLSGRSRDPA